MNETTIIFWALSGIAGLVFAKYDKKIFWYINDRINFYYTETYILDDVIVQYHLFWDHLHFQITHRNAGVEMGFGDPRGGK